MLFKRSNGAKWLDAGLQPKRGSVSLLPQPTRRSAKLSRTIERARRQRRVDYLRLAEILSGFAAANKIEYPLLSDAGSKVIRAFGILNDNVPEGHAMMFGMPFPGNYLIASDGTVRDKLFLPNYEHRPSASQAVLKHFSTAARIRLKSRPTPLPWRSPFPSTIASRDRSGLTLDVRLDPGWHIYGKHSRRITRRSNWCWKARSSIGNRSISLLLSRYC